MNKNKFTLYVDMDEVICDFVGGACRIHGVNHLRNEVDNFRIENKTWCMVEAVGRLKTPRNSDFGVKDFWRPILNAGESFWANLDPTPWANHLITKLNSSKYAKRWYILSSPINHHDCHSGKIKWLRRFFGPEFNRFILTPHKELFSRPGAILIDDNHHNLEKFSESVDMGGESYTVGGIGYLFGSSPMAHPEDRKNPVEAFEKFLERIENVEYQCP